MPKNVKNCIKNANKRLLLFEVLSVCFSLVIMLSLLFLAETAYNREDMPNWVSTTLVVLGLVQFIAGALLALLMEREIGFYECSKCDNKYVPSYMSMLIAPHLGLTRYMKCPKCGEWSWQHKNIEESLEGDKEE